MICAECGHNNPQGATSCQKCGRALSIFDAPTAIGGGMKGDDQGADRSDPFGPTVGIAGDHNQDFESDPFGRTRVVTDDQGPDPSDPFGPTRMGGPEPRESAEGHHVIAGRYEIIRPLGQGGMGVVFLAKDMELRGREVALKMIHPELLASEQARARFEEEVIISQELTHPNIVKVFDLKRDLDRRFFTMEYIPGRSLRQEIENRKAAGQAFSFEETATVIGQILDALEHAHTKTVHRDIKPENVMISGSWPDVQARLTDFGIAKTLSQTGMTATAQTMGTAYYMAPEQLAGAREVTPAADLYSVGVVFYEMLTGQIPMGMAAPPSTLVQGLPAEVDDVSRKALDMSADRRFGSAAAFRQALAGVTQVVTRMRLVTDERRGQIPNWLSMARFRLTSGKLDEAREFYGRILEIDPDNADAKAGLAEIEAAIDREAAEKHKQRHQQWLAEADKALEEGRFNQAEAVYREVLFEDPENQDARQVLEKIAEKKEHQEKIDSLVAEADQELQAGRFDEAKALYEKALAEDSEHEGAKAGLKEVEKRVQIKDLLSSGQSAFEEKKFRTATHFFDLVLAKDPDNREALEGTIKIFLSSGQSALKENNFQKATHFFNLVLAKDPENREALEGQVDVVQTVLTLANNAFEKGQHPEAENFFKIVLAAEERNAVARQGLEKIEANRKKERIGQWLVEARSAFERKRYQDAKNKFDKVLAEDSTHVEADKGSKEAQMLLLAALARKRRRIVSVTAAVLAIALIVSVMVAYQAYRRVQVRATTIATLLTQAKTAFEKKRYEKANSLYGKILNLDTNNAEAIKGVKNTYQAAFSGGARTVTNSIGMKFVLIPTGKFMMGRPSTERSLKSDEGPQHRVVISRPFYMQTTEVTQSQYRAIMGTNPSRFKGCDQCPVERVSWNDAQKFVRRLNAREKTNKYRLPTEAEWEYACRAGTTTPFSFGQTISTDQANYNGNSVYGSGRKGVYHKKTTPVASFPPNKWGLYDMHGNVWEWCFDLYRKDYYRDSPTRDPQGPSSGNVRVFRGGSWYDGPGRLRSAYRRTLNPWIRSKTIGFRVVRTY